MKYLILILLISCSKFKSDSDTEVIRFIDYAPPALAAQTTASENAACISLGDFYWEIGNKDSVLVSGQTGTKTVGESTKLLIASATKLVFASYVVELKNGNLSAPEIKYLTMQSGYTNFDNFSCNVETVEDCFNQSQNSQYAAETEDKFFYNGGHFQKLAMDLNLGSLDNSSLISEVNDVLNLDASWSFTSPQLAGGMSASAQDYRKFLQKIVNGSLLMKEALGSNSICADATCSEYSPFPEGLNYSLGHWVEEDGSFSSAGLFGFYPWIDKDKKLYGIISRHRLSLNGGEGEASLRCGTLIRKAFQTGIVQ